MTDDEFELITADTQDYTQELYSEVIAVLDSREAVSATRDRVKFYFQAKGVSVEAAAAAASSNIFFGDEL